MVYSSKKEINNLFNKIGLQTAKMLILKYVKDGLFTIYLCFDSSQHPTLKRFMSNFIKYGIAYFMTVMNSKHALHDLTVNCIWAADRAAFFDNRFFLIINTHAHSSVAQFWLSIARNKFCSTETTEM